MTNSTFRSLTKKKPDVVLLILLLAALFPYFYASLYTNPIADDFTYAAKSRDLGILTAWTQEYLGWNGRYASNFFVLLNPIVFGSFIVYKIIPVLLLILHLLCYYRLIDLLTQHTLRSIQTWKLSLLFLLLYLHTLPDLAEGIYWYTGAVTYQLGNILAMAYFCMLLSYVQGPVFKNKILHLCIAGLLLVLATGCNEVLMLLLLGIHTLLVYINSRHRQEHRNTYLFFFSLTLFSALFLIFSPGNSTRESLFSNTHNLPLSVGYSLLQTMRFSLSWLVSVPLLILSVFYIERHRHLCTRYPLFRDGFHLTPLISSLFLLGSIFVCAFPAYWSTGILGQHRTINVAWFFFMPLWFINLNVWLNRTRLGHIANIYLSFRHKNWFFALLLCGLLFTRNGYHVLTDLISGCAAEYNTQMEARYTIIKQNAGDTLTFEAIRNPPQSLFVLDVNTNPAHWANKGYTLYFGIPGKTIVRKDAPAR